MGVRWLHVDVVQHGWSPGSAGLKTAVASFEFAFENGTVKSVRELVEPLVLTIIVPPYVTLCCGGCVGALSFASW